MEAPVLQMPVLGHMGFTSGRLFGEDIWPGCATSLSEEASIHSSDSYGDLE